MLNKIQHININTELHSGGTMHHYEHEDAKIKSSTIVFNDSIYLSPAYQHLKKIRWQLRKIKKIGQKKYSCNILLANYNLTAEFEVNTYGKVEGINYFIFKPDVEKIITLELEVSTSDSKKNNFQDELTFANLKLLFIRLENLTLDNELNEFDSNVLNILFDGISEGIDTEFSYINYNIIHFVNKHFNVNLYPINSTHNFPVIKIKRIRLIDEHPKL